MHLAGRAAAHNYAVIRTLRCLSRHARCSSTTPSPAHTLLRGRPSLEYETPIKPRPVPNPLAKEVAILGGGITGLSTAFNIAVCLPQTKITIYEADSRLGGWMNSEVVQVDNGEVLFEWGPRTLRPALSQPSGAATVSLLAQLDLLEEIVPTGKKTPAALNRYIYYPDHLVRLPSPPRGVIDLFNRWYSLFTEPIFSGVMKGMFRELTTPARDEKLQDESVGRFLSRRFGKDIADNLASAFFHGIYAGDLYKLSARTLLPLPWFAETKDGSESSSVILELLDVRLKGMQIYQQSINSFTAGMKGMALVEHFNFYKSGPIESLLGKASVYTLRRGLGDLVRRLEQALSQNPNVTIKKQSRVTAVNSNKGRNKLSIHVADSKKGSQVDYVVSTLSPGSMASFLEQSAQSRDDAHSKVVAAACKHSHRSVNVMVVNLYYSDPDLIPPSLAGFGYLIPRSVPFEQNPERALGVIFGSETSGRRGSAHVRTRKVARSDVERLLQNLREQREDLLAQQRSLEKIKIEKPEFTADRDLEELLRQGLSQIDQQIKDTTREAEEWFGPDLSQEKAEIKVAVGQDSAPGTKLTVMMGGHWWDDWVRDDLPNEEEAITMAKALLRRHLDITDEPQVAKARLAENCIPQYPVGYRKDMATIHEGLMSEYQGRFKVAGPWWQGAVGVSDCIRKGRETAWAIREQWDDKTGLEHYTENEKWIINHSQSGVSSIVGGGHSR